MIKNKISILLLFVNAFMFCQTIIAQKNIKTDFVPKSPEAAAFDRVSEIPINEYTGTAQFSIPLYTVTNGDISLPISLDYQGTAIRVDQEATWVGLNWLLNAGGCITTHGSASSNRSNSYLRPGQYEDEWDFLLNRMSLTSGYLGDSYFQIPFKIDGIQPNRGTYGRNWFQKLVTLDTEGYHDSDISYALYDEILNYHNGEAQTFHAVFMGISLTFVWDRLRQEFFQTGTKRNYKIEGTPSYITITDGKGVKYYFGLTEEIFPSGSQDDMNHIVYDGTLYLTKIESPTGHAIKLNYADEGTYWPTRHIVETLYDNRYPVAVLNEPASTDYRFQIVGGSNGPRLVRTITPYYCINKKRLSSISSDSLLVKFIANTPREDLNVRTNVTGNYSASSVNRLDEIDVVKIENGENKTLKKYVFSYGYFPKNTIGGNTLQDYWDNLKTGSSTDRDYYHEFYSNDEFIYKRLRLDQLQEVGADGTKKPQYRFYYDPQPLPGKNSSSQDYWGYYNGQENYNGNMNYHTLLPKSFMAGTADGVSSFNDQFNYLSCFGADRRSVPGKTSACMLTSVTYPTGGSVRYSYEGNTFGNHTYAVGNHPRPSDAYFNQYVTTYESKHGTTVEVMTNTNEFNEPGNRRNVNSCVFILPESCDLQWTTYYSQSCGADMPWASLFGKKVILYECESVDDGYGNTAETFTPLDTMALNYSDVSRTQRSTQFSRTITLPAGKYKLETDRLWSYGDTSNGYFSIASRLSSKGVYMDYVEKTLTKLRNLHANEPTLGRESSVSSTVVNNIRIYDCNQTGYSNPSADRNSKCFLIDDGQWVDIEAIFSTNQLLERYLSFFQYYSLSLYSYSVIQTENGSFEAITDTCKFLLNASDITEGNQQAKIRKTVWLEPGRYELRIPEFYKTSSPIFLYEEGKISLNSMMNSKQTSCGNGLRVASIARNDQGIIDQTEYSYEDSLHRTSGILLNPSVFSREKILVYQSQTSVDPDGRVHSQAQDIRYTLVSSENMASNSPSIGYGHVTESHFSNDNKLKGSRKYEFWNRVWTSLSNFLPKVEDPRNGLLVGEEVFDGNGKLKTATHTNYSLEKAEHRLLSPVIENLYKGPRQAYFVNALSDYNPWREAAGGGIMDIYLYPSVQFRLASQSTNSLLIEGNGNINHNKKTYFNAENCQPSREEVSTSVNGVKDVTDYMYPADIDSLNWIQSLKDKHITDCPILVTESQQSPSKSIVTSSTFYQYDDYGLATGCFARKINGEVNYQPNVTVNISGLPTSDYFREALIEYDEVSHNPRMVTDKNGVHTVYVWGYGNKYPIATIMGVSKDIVINALGGLNALREMEADAVPAMSMEMLYARLASISGAMVNVYEYDPYVGLVGNTLPTGNCMRYEYDAFQRLKSISDSKGKINQYYYNYKQ